MTLRRKIKAAGRLAGIYTVVLLANVPVKIGLDYHWNWEVRNYWNPAPPEWLQEIGESAIALQPWWALAITLQPTSDGDIREWMGTSSFLFWGSLLSTVMYLLAWRLAARANRSFQDENGLLNHAWEKFIAQIRSS